MNIFLILLAGVVIILALHGALFFHKVSISKTLIEKAESFSLDTADYSTTLLVLGDSTAVGVGADSSKDTVAALFAQHVGATYVENRAVSGAIVADLETQIKSASLEEYSFILIEIGGNDIIRFHNVDTVTGELRELLEALPKTKNLIVHSAGNVGAATTFPWFIRPFHTSRNLAYHKALEEVVRAKGGTYVNLYLDPSIDPFSLHPEIYLAKDGLHPSSAGYKLWFETIAKSIK